MLGLAGIFMAFLPIIHVHTFISISMITFFLILLFTEKNIKEVIRNLFYFFFPAAILGAWQILLIFNVGTGSAKIQLGWMSKKEDWFIFWAKNLGLYFILLPIIFLTLKKRIKLIYISFFPLFIVTNIFLFQPHDYDNIKIMSYWFIATAAIFSVFLIKIWEKNIYGRIIAIFIVLILVSSSLIDTFHLFLHPGYKFFSKQDIEIARIIRENTPENAIFLTSDQHNHFVPTLTGRQIIMGYRGWLWTYGINYDQRYIDILEIYQGTNTNFLLKKYNIDYVVIGQSEKTNYFANEAYYDKNYSLFLNKGGVKIFKIRD
jgi:hypothetical protein